MKPIVPLILWVAGSIAGPSVSQEPGLLVVGKPLPRQLAIPGVVGGLDVAPWLVLSPRSETSLLPAGLRAPVLRGLFGQFLEAVVVGGRTAWRLRPAHALENGGVGQDSSSEIEYPLLPTIELKLSRAPEHNNFTRYLTFVNYLGGEARVPVEFRKRSGLTWDGTVTAEGLALLGFFCEVNFRSYWDQFRLENRGGSTRLDIARLKVVMNYDVPSSRESAIPTVDSWLGRTLESGSSLIPLNKYARRTRRSWAGVDSSAHRVVLAAVDDLGKSGSDGIDGFGSNPKYGGATELLCSEFVSWYYHEAGLGLGDFGSVTETKALHGIFAANGRAYRYDQGRGGFVHKDTEAAYTPKAGDFLGRKGSDGDWEHSMIMLRWDAATKTATVINGPWPVTLRIVKVHDDEVSNGKDFWVGRIPG